jgi:hypothetical protein
MFHKVAVKWLSITVIALMGFLIVLLFLGYLLKENEVKTIKLKAQLDQEAYQQQAKENRKKTFSSISQITLSASEKSQQKVIANNLDCQSDKQCFLVHTDSQALGCIVTVNTNGAVILLKIVSESKIKASSNGCQQEYEKAHGISAQCRNNFCSL